MSQKKTEEEKPKQTLAWKCLCDECPNRDKCFELLQKSGALKKLGITNPSEMHEKLGIAILAFFGGVAADEIIRRLFREIFSGKRRRKGLFER